MRDILLLCLLFEFTRIKFFLWNQREFPPLHLDLISFHCLLNSNKSCVRSPEQLISAIIMNVNYLFVIRNERLTGKFLLFDELTFD